MYIKCQATCESPFFADCRVNPEEPLSRLRDLIDEQLGYEILPRDFVFLHSVGRCFTRVSFRPFSAGTVFTRQNLTSKDVGF